MTVFISELANVSIMHAFYFYVASYRITAILYHQDNTVRDTQIICLKRIHKTGNVTY